jgi:hypothetical protein
LIALLRYWLSIGGCRKMERNLTALGLNNQYFGRSDANAHQPTGSGRGTTASPPAAAMKLWLLTQDENENYDATNAAVVVAADEAAARRIMPGCVTSIRWVDLVKMWIGTRKDGSTYQSDSSNWVTPDKVSVRLLGEAAAGTPEGALCYGDEPGY